MINSGVVPVFGTIVRIHFFDSASRDDTAMGRSDSKLGIIHLNRDMPADLQEAVLLHEIGHVVADALGMKWGEADNAALMTGIYAVLSDSERTIKMTVITPEMAERMR